MGLPPNRQEGDGWAGPACLILAVIVTEPVQLIVVIRIVVRILDVAPIIIWVSAVTLATISAHIHLLSSICYFVFLLPPEFRAAALCARVAKLPFDTVPPACRAAALWMRAAALCVIGFGPALPFFAPLLIFISSGAGCVPRDVRAATATGCTGLFLRTPQI